jgi:hypothetical protein
MAKKSVKLKDLQAATAASIKAVLGKKFVGRTGVLAGILIDPEQIQSLTTNPTTLAKELAAGVSAASGIKVKPAIQIGKGGILVGYVQPKIMGE